MAAGNFFGGQFFGGGFFGAVQQPIVGGGPYLWQRQLEEKLRKRKRSRKPIVVVEEKPESIVFKANPEEYVPFLPGLRSSAFVTVDGPTYLPLEDIHIVLPSPAYIAHRKKRRKRIAMIAMEMD